MPAYDSELEKFAALDAQVVGISVDNTYCHTAWQQKEIGLLHFPLASDFWPHGAVAEQYGILRTGDPVPGINERAMFIVDKQGKLAFAKVYELGQQPENEECFQVLRKLQGVAV